MIVDLRTPREEHLCLTSFDHCVKTSSSRSYWQKGNFQVLELTVSICRAWTPTQLEILWNPTGPEKGRGEGLLSASYANAENHPSSAGVSRSVPQTTVSSAQVGDSQSRNFPQPYCPLGNSDRNRE